MDAKPYYSQNICRPELEVCPCDTCINKVKCSSEKLVCLDFRYFTDTGAYRNKDRKPKAIK